MHVTPTKYSVMRKCDAIATDMTHDYRVGTTAVVGVLAGVALVNSHVVTNNHVGLWTRVSCALVATTTMVGSCWFAQGLWATRDCLPNGRAVACYGLFGYVATYLPARWEIVDKSTTDAEIYQVFVKGPKWIRRRARREFTLEPK